MYWRQGRLRHGVPEYETVPFPSLSINSSIRIYCETNFTL
jgi:hypothetical protein